MRKNKIKRKQKFLKKLDLKLDEELEFIYGEYFWSISLEIMEFIYITKSKVNSHFLVLLKEKIIKDARVKLFKSIKPNSFDELFW